MKISSCENPKYIINPYTGKSMLVPCRVCPSCRLASGDIMSKRLEDEFNLWKYSVFFTLTYADEFLPRLEPYGSLLVHNLDLNTQSNKFIQYDYKNCKFCQNRLKEFGFIPVLSKTDASKFIKELRKQLFSVFGEVEFNWFLVGEYGSSSYRPHLHGSLFYNDSRLHQGSSLSSELSRCICFSWSDALRGNNTSDRYQLGRVDVQGIARGRNYAFRYVAQYLNCHTDLPQVLQSKEFSQFRKLPKGKVIGLPAESLVSLSELFYCGIVSRVVTDSKGKQCVALLPASYRRSVFCEHRGFDNVPSWCLESWCNYVTGKSCTEFIDSILDGSFIDFFDNNYNTLYLFLDDDDTNMDIFVTRLKSFYYCLIKVVRVCKTFGCPLWDYQFYYLQYKSKLELFTLREFYQLQADLSLDVHFDIRFLNCLYYYDDSSSYRLAVECDNFAYFTNKDNCPQYRSDKLLSLRIFLDSTKTKKRNDYVTNKNLLNY